MYLFACVGVVAGAGVLDVAWRAQKKVSSTHPRDTGVTFRHNVDNPFRGGMSLMFHQEKPTILLRPMEYI
jgi:hypothetical protein